MIKKSQFLQYLNLEKTNMGSKGFREIMLAILFKKNGNEFQHLNLKSNYFGFKDIDYVCQKLGEHMAFEI